MTPLQRAAIRRGIQFPTPATLRRYGMVLDEWLRLLKDQGWKCPICLKKHGVRWCVDHRHVPGWEKMAPSERRRHVRGILCSYCNYRRVHSHMDAPEAFRIAGYFAAFERRRGA